MTAWPAGYGYAGAHGVNHAVADGIPDVPLDPFVESHTDAHGDGDADRHDVVDDHAVCHQVGNANAYVVALGDNVAIHAAVA